LWTYMENKDNGEKFSTIDMQLWNVAKKEESEKKKKEGEIS